MHLLEIDYRESKVHMEVASTLATNLPLGKEIVVVNIGTDRVIGDSIGPLVGTMLESLGIKAKVYGTLEKPIHALNLEERYIEIHKEHPEAFIIATDACLGPKTSVGQIQVRQAPIAPGKGVGKRLPSIGDISIVAIVKEFEENNRFNFNDIRLNFVMNLAEVIAFGIFDSIN